MAYRGKRILDIGVSLGALLALLPLMLALALLVRTRLGRPVLFRQQRAGLHGRQFTLVKFRSLLQPIDTHGRPLSEEQRLTPLGTWLRASGLDELPQLLLVLRGRMSLVGPRPLLPGYLPLYSPRQSRRHQVRPGLTGWAQVRAAQHADWDERLALDVEYVERASLGLDLRILWMTIVRQLRRLRSPAESALPHAPFRGGGE